MGRIEEAAKELRSVQQEFLNRQMPVYATAAEILPIFEAQGLTTEAIVVYILLQLERAVEGRTVKGSSSPPNSQRE